MNEVTLCVNRQSPAPQKQAVHSQKADAAQPRLSGCESKSRVA
jgi:hypothetical protein